MSVDTPFGQVLEFLTVTSAPRQGINGEEARRIVRSHAIRDANRRKRLKEATEPKKIRGAATYKPPPQSSLTTKFKLNKKPAKERKVAPQEYDEWNGSYLSHGTSRRPLNHTLLISVGNGGFDPFDTLPIKIGPRQQALINYQTSQLKQSAFTIGEKAGLFSLAVMDSAWLNSILCLISLHHDLQVGKGISHECLMYRAETLRIVNQRLIESPQHVAEETIGAIASLASFETMNGFFESATMHVNGLVEIMANRGPLVDGLLPLENVFLQKIVAWTDLSYCTTWDLAPNLPLLTTKTCRGSISEFILYFRTFFPPDTYICSPHDLLGEMTDIFQTMRLLSTRVHSLPTEMPERMVFDRGLYMSEYKLLVILDPTDGLEDGRVVPNRNSHIYGSCRLAAYLYLYIVLRELPASAMIVQTVVSRLKGILEKSCADILLLWKEDQHLFLWILYIGAVASTGPLERTFFVKVLRRLTLLMGLDNCEVFSRALKEVLWEPEFCEKGPTTGVLWAELQQQ